jgi:hypothetical protein
LVGQVDSRSAGSRSDASDLGPRSAYCSVLHLKNVLYERDFFA